MECVAKLSVSKDCKAFKIPKNDTQSSTLSYIVEPIFEACLTILD